MEKRLAALEVDVDEQLEQRAVQVPVQIAAA